MHISDDADELSGGLVISGSKLRGETYEIHIYLPTIVSRLSHVE